LTLECNEGEGKGKEKGEDLIEKIIIFLRREN